MKNYFTEAELKCKCGNCYGTMNAEFMEKLNLLREHCGFPFIISSAYRCKEHNKKVGGAPRSAHTLGRAVDVVVSGAEAVLLITACVDFGFNGLGVQQNKKKGAKFIHIDDAHENFTIWSY